MDSCKANMIKAISAYKEQKKACFTYIALGDMSIFNLFREDIENFNEDINFICPLYRFAVDFYGVRKEREAVFTGLRERVCG